MKKTFSFLSGFILCVGFWSASLYSQTTSAGRCGQSVAQMKSVQGTVEVRLEGETQWRSARLNDTYCAGDTIHVFEKSRADITFSNQPVLHLDQDSIITFGGVKEKKSLVEMIQGAIHFFSRAPQSLEVQTAFVNAGVEGTEFFITADQNRTFISVFEGKILASNAAGSLSLTDGQAAVTEQGKAPVLQVVARPRDAVQWSLYYPPVLYFKPGEFQSGTGWQGMVSSSLEAYLSGDLQQAFDRIANAPGNISDPRFFVYRASLLLAVGRVDEADADINRALKLNPDYSHALALQSIVAAVQNNKAQALDLARKAVAADPQSSSALVDLSYAQQANFDLEGARDSLEKAVELEPGNALAWARLAELYMSFGKLNEAQNAAGKAVDANPDLSRTQTVLGFAYLMRVKTTEAQEAFEKAISLDQADPLPRLGLGLTRIRDGALHEGRKEIETAVSLGSGSSIIRSYLGKAYYEERQDKLASDQYEEAERTDPQDPTPYFYDAIRKQTTNRPVEALDDLQEAIDRNDNRAVYRSRLLLDSDLAARSASLARIYTDLGFQQLALVEGWKSVNTDPMNFSSHRFLADSYSALPRHEIARVSELLQSQLLQPINSTPIQPRLAESNLLLISAEGPGSLSFNEFNPIFNRDGMSAQASFLGGENSSIAGEAIAAGIYKNASFSIGYSHFETDGFRENADQYDNLVNAFVQFELSPKTSVQAEYRYRDIDTGDLDLNFFPEDFRAIYATNQETHTIRAGLRRALSPNSLLLGSFMYQRRDSRMHDEPSVPFINYIDNVTDDQNAYSGEAQYIFRSEYVDFTGGLGYFDINGENEQTAELNFPPPPYGPGIIQDITLVDLDTKHTDVYVYSNVKPRKDVVFTLGGSGDFFDTKSSDAEKTNQFNPKFGFSWNPHPSTTIRAAAFRTLKRTLITDQTLEPTQVAGFNQFFDDIDSTKAWRYGVAIDQKFSQFVFAGAELSKRDLEIPLRNITEDIVLRLDEDEYSGRGYVFLTPHPWFAFTVEYQYDLIKRAEDFVFQFTDAKTHSVPLGVKFFHPSGLSASLRGTYFNQRGDFIRRGGEIFESGKDDFWVLDASLSYRLPRRYGFVAVGATNLTDEEFMYQETDLRNLRIQPDRVVFVRFILAVN
jgi:tetratricopeptide (TPR) repeat protein